MIGESVSIELFWSAIPWDRAPAVYAASLTSA